MPRVKPDPRAGYVLVGLATVADSLAAVEAHVVERGRLTWDEMLAHLDADCPPARLGFRDVESPLLDASARDGLYPIDLLMVAAPVELPGFTVRWRHGDRLRLRVSVVARDHDFAALDRRDGVVVTLEHEDVVADVDSIGPPDGARPLDPAPVDIGAVGAL